MKPTRLLTLALGAAALLASASQAAAPQKPTTAQPTQAQLEEKINALEARVTAAEQKATAAEKKADASVMEKEYIERSQKDAKDYYDKVLTHTTAWAGIIALVITIIPGFFALFSFRVFDRHVKRIVGETAAQLKKDSAAELTALSDSLKTETKAQLETLKVRSNFNILAMQAMGFKFNGKHEGALLAAGGALSLFFKNPGKIDRPAIQPVITLIFLTQEAAYPNDFPEWATKELEKPEYSDLGPELAQAALEVRALVDVLKNRKK